MVFRVRRFNRRRSPSSQSPPVEGEGTKRGDYVSSLRFRANTVRTCAPPRLDVCHGVTLYPTVIEITARSFRASGRV
jgi:hypothetical protein